MKYLVILVLLFNDCALAEDISVQVDDCGPLARGELGVVFSLKPHGSGKAYFTKGNASDLCPLLVTAQEVIGYVEGYCENYKPRVEKECSYIKVFVINEINGES